MNFKKTKHCYLIFFMLLLLSSSSIEAQNTAVPNSFIDITDSTGTGDPGIGVGFGLADFNHDANLDIYLVNRGGNILFQNQGFPGYHFVDFTDSAKVSGTSANAASGAALVDYNNDGFTDLLTYFPLELFQNSGDGTFENVTAASGIRSAGEVSAAAFFDYDNDGDLDLFLVTADDQYSNRLFQNRGAPVYDFIDRTSIAQVGTHKKAQGCIFFDYNNDGLQDIYSINRDQPNQLFENRGNGTFQEAAAGKNLALTGLFTGVSTADYDNDGDLDLYLTVSAGPNLLMQNSGPPDFSFSEAEAGVGLINNGLVSAWGDYDNDGYTDIFICNPYGENTLYRNNSDGGFSNLAAIEGLDQPTGSVANFWDFNNDGRLDIYAVNTSGANKLFKNVGAQGNWIKIKLVGIESNRDGLGARISVFTDGNLQTRELNGQHPGAFSQNSQPEHFGLADAAFIDSMQIQWPSGKKMRLSNIPANRMLIIREDEILPQSPLLEAPLDLVALNESPLFEWQVPEDPNNDSLHFRIEIAEDSLFGNSIIFDSWRQPEGFSPAMPVAGGSGSVSFSMPSTLKDGPYWWRVFAYDRVGLSLPTAAWKFMLDRVLPNNPTACIETHGAISDTWQNFNNEPEFFINGAIDEASGIAGYQVYWGDDPAGTSDERYDTDSLRFAAVSDGRRFLRVRAIDRAGNIAETWATLFIHKYDGTPPTGTTASSVSVTDTTSFCIHWENTARDAGGSGLTGHYAIRRKVDTGSWEMWHTDFVGTAIFDSGEHGHRYAYEIAAKDAAGNVEAFSANAETIILIDANSTDTSAPPAPYNLQAAGASPSPWQADAGFQITWTQPYDRSGIARCFYKLTAPPISDADTSGTAPGMPGIIINATENYSQWLYLWLEDGAGNRQFTLYDSVWLRYDPLPPAITRKTFTPADYGMNWYNPHINPDLSVQFEYREQVPQIARVWVDESTDTLEIGELSSGEAQSFEFEIDISGFSDGAHKLFALLEDSAGNVLSDTSIFHIDGTAPVNAQASAPDTSKALQMLVRWQGTASDGTGSGLAGVYDIHYRKDSREWQTLRLKYAGESLRFTGEHGHTYEFEVAAYDRVGNREHFQNIAETSTYFDTTAHTSQTPPEKPILKQPVPASFVNAAHPVFSWLIPADVNNDSLHFKVEISSDSLFGAEAFVFESQHNTPGFSPVPPRMADSGEIQFITPETLADKIYWWRVTAYDGYAYGLISQAQKFAIDTRFPGNPSVCIDKNGTTSNIWQNKLNQPSFEWQGASDDGSGVAGYLVYWGTNPRGDSTLFSSAAQYSPDFVSSGIHYLRLRTKDNAGNRAINWSTLFVFKFDNIPPAGATASTPRFSQGETFVVKWGNTAVDSGGAGLTGHYAIYVNKDSSGWNELYSDLKADSIILTGELGHTYGFEAVARDSAGNVEVRTGVPETVIRVAPPNAPPEAPNLLSPPDGSFILSELPELIWTVPNDTDKNPLHFQVEVSRNPAFSNLPYVMDSRKNLDGFISIPASQPGEGTAKFIFQDSLADGRYWWRVKAWDGLLFGAASESFGFILDTTPPSTQHTPVASAVNAEPIQVTVVARDSLSGVASKQLIYKPGGRSDLHTVEIISESALIPGNEVTARGVEYAITATDQLGNSSRLPGTGFFSVSVVVAGNGVIKPTTQPTGEAQTAYRMLSVPLLLNEPNPADVLQDDLGFYDRKQWRLFSYRQRQFTEYGFTGDFEPGRPFWLIVKEPKRDIDSGPGQTVTTADPYSIPVDSASWTMVANPFNFPVPLSCVSLASGEPLLNIITYDGQWRLGTELTELEAWEGYMVKATTATALLVDPTAIGADSIGKLVSVSTANSSGAWSIQIKARCQAASDQCNFVGVRKNAQNEWDQNDLFEPPTIGDYVQVRFPHLDWACYPDYYTTDYRPVEEAGHFWDFEASTSLKASEVSLKFVRIDSIPADYQLVLIDRKMKIAKELSQSCDYHFTSGTSRRVQKFRMIAGNQAFVEAHDLGAIAMPTDYQLSQNFPNPFNNQTLIRFFLPQTERIQLNIYNILGEEIVCLLDNESRSQGFHTIPWNGKNRGGVEVASGIYFYHFMTASGKLNKIRKMVVVR